MLHAILLVRSCTKKIHSAFFLLRIKRKFTRNEEFTLKKNEIFFAFKIKKNVRIKDDANLMVTKER